MKNLLRNILKLTSLGLVGLGFYQVNSGNAINTAADGWKWEQDWEIDTPEGCRAVNNHNGAIRFIPTKTMPEWVTFRDGAPPKGITVAACAAPVTTGSDAGGDGGGGDGTYMERVYID